MKHILPHITKVKSSGTYSNTSVSIGKWDMCMYNFVFSLVWNNQCRYWIGISPTSLTKHQAKNYRHIYILYIRKQGHWIKDMPDKPWWWAQPETGNAVILLNCHPDWPWVWMQSYSVTRPLPGWTVHAARCLCGPWLPFSAKEPSAKYVMCRDFKSWKDKR